MPVCVGHEIDIKILVGEMPAELVILVFAQPVFHIPVIRAQFRGQNGVEEKPVHLKMADRFPDILIIHTGPELLFFVTPAQHERLYFFRQVRVIENVVVRHLPHSEFRIQVL